MEGAQLKNKMSNNLKQKKNKKLDPGEARAPLGPTWVRLCLTVIGRPTNAGRYSQLH